MSPEFTLNSRTQLSSSSGFSLQVLYWFPVAVCLSACLSACPSVSVRPVVSTLAEDAAMERCVNFLLLTTSRLCSHSPPTPSPAPCSCPVLPTPTPPSLITPPPPPQAPASRFFGEKVRLLGRPGATRRPPCLPGLARAACP